MSFKDKIVIVTGATRGIGYEIAKQFAEQHATVIISGRNLDTCTSIANKLAEDTHGNVEGIDLDLSNTHSCKTFVANVIEKHTKIDILVNNAGITKDNLLLRMSEEQWSDVINTNLTGTFSMIKHSIKSMLKQKKGRIINLSSVIGIMGNAGQCNYAASKGGIIALTKSIAKEFGAKGITCNSIAPGFIETNMTKTLPTKQIEAIINQVPVKRMGTVEDVAKLTLFLASDSSAYITGQAIQIDGGLNM